MQNAVPIIKFFKRRQEIVSEIKNRGVRKSLIKLPSFFQQYYKLKSKLLKKRRVMANDFNIFKIAKFQTKEARLHSPFLSHLLNPLETHSQHNIFLVSFFKSISSLKNIQIDQWDYKYLKVFNELDTRHFGQIDILIHYAHPSNPFVIIIENKIYADDQPLQLERYYKFAKQVLHLRDSQIKLLYLCLDICSPSIHSISAEQKIHLEKEKILESISYGEHIIPWLEKNIYNIQAPVVKQTVLQYILTLKQLCYADSI